MLPVTHKLAKSRMVDYLSDYERRELDCWIAKYIDQVTVEHTTNGVEHGSMVRLSDLAWQDYMKQNPSHEPTCIGPFPVPHYSFNPVLALNAFQDTEYAEGWMFVREKGKWSGANDGLTTPRCKSFALCLMLALQHEYNFQNQKENTQDGQDNRPM